MNLSSADVLVTTNLPHNYTRMIRLKMVCECYLNGVGAFEHRSGDIPQAAHGITLKELDSVPASVKVKLCSDDYKE